MKIVRCPECGNRLKTNYCHMCMKRVPVYVPRTGESAQQYTPPKKTGGHTCISFEQPQESGKKQIPDVFTKVAQANQQRRSAKNNKKSTTAVAIGLAVLSLISSLAGVFSEVTEETVVPRPDFAVEELTYNWDEDFYTPAGEPGAESLQELVPAEIYNQDGLVITAESIGIYYADPAVLYTITNLSDRAVEVCIEYPSVNGYMLNNLYFSSIVDSGEVWQDLLILDDFSLDRMDIQTVAEVAFQLDIYDNVTGESIADGQTVTLQTLAAEYFVQPEVKDGQQIYNQNGLRMVLLSASIDDGGDCVLEFYLENTGEEFLTVADQGIYINDVESGSWLWGGLRPGTRTIYQINVYDGAELKLQDLEDLETARIELCIQNGQVWDLETSVYDTVTFDFS